MARICTMAERQAQRSLRECAKALPGRTDAGVARDPDSVHDARVGCRRARVTLAEFGGQFNPGARREAREQFRRVRKRLGKLRELDMNIALADEFAEACPEGAAIARERLWDLRRAAEADSGDADAVTDGSSLAERVVALREAVRQTTACYRKHAEKRLKKRLEKLARQHKIWRKSRRDDDLHQLRIRFKKMRYTLEVYAGLYGKQGHTLLDDLEDTQDALGDWNDLRILNEYVSRMARDAPRADRKALKTLAAEIQSRQEERLASVEDDVEKFFKKDRIKAAKALFGKPQVPCCDKG